MLAHDFQETEGHSVEIGDKPSEIVMLLKCRWCNRAPKKARQDGCPSRELAEIGSIVLSEFNPDGVKHFKGRQCLTCKADIMGHWLRHGSEEYWCQREGGMPSDGIADCTWDVDGVAVPAEPTLKAPTTVTVDYKP